MMTTRSCPVAQSQPVISLLHDTRGAVAIEYGLLVAMIAIALIGMSNFADTQSAMFDYISTHLAQ
jgi:Flp pilus assembly pilin Flp